MPRIIARQPDGSFLVAVGFAGLIVPASGRLPALASGLHLSSVDSVLARVGWLPADDEVPAGLLSEQHLAAMRRFDREFIDGLGLFERERFLAYRPDTGDPLPGR